MIISHKYKFIFIKTAKTASTSIEVFLSPLCAVDDVLTPVYPHVPPHRARNYQDLELKNHASAREIRKKIDPEIWNSYYKFCVERNPWDKVLSHYHMLRYRAEGALTLDSYFDNGALPRNYGKYTDKDGSVMVNEIIKYENLNAGLAETFRRLGVPYNGSLGVRAKSEYRVDRRPYVDVFTRDQLAHISRLFANEIEMHKYSMASTAPRHGG